MIPYYRWKHIITKNTLQEKYWAAGSRCHYYTMYKTTNYFPVIDILSENGVDIFVSNTIIYPSQIVHDEADISHDWNKADEVHSYTVKPLRITQFTSIAVCQPEKDCVRKL